MGHNEKRFLKSFSLWKRILRACAGSERPERRAQYVADEIEKRAELGFRMKRWQSFSAFATDARPVAEEFLERKIPFQMKSGFESILTILSQRYLRLFQAGSGNIERNDLFASYEPP